MNKAILMGRLTGDPDVRVNGETTIARYRLAVDRWTEGADFIPCVTFNKGADFAEKYLRKGMKICVVGRIQTGSYANKDGQKVYTTDVIVDEHHFCESKQNKAAEEPRTNDGFMDIPDDDPDLLFN